MSTETKTTTPKPETITITLTDARPLKVRKDRWPLVARASEDRDHNKQELFRRYYLRVRLHCSPSTDGSTIAYHAPESEPDLQPHADGRCVVYGWYETSWQGEAGISAGYECTLDQAPATIRRVGQEIGAAEWLIVECIGDLPPVDTDETEDGEGLPCTVTLSITVKTIEQAQSLADSLIEMERALRADCPGIAAGESMARNTALHGEVARVRRNLQDRVGLILSGGAA